RCPHSWPKISLNRSQWELRSGSRIRLRLPARFSDSSPPPRKFRTRCVEKIKGEHCRTPKRGRPYKRRLRACVVECGGAPPLFERIAWEYRLIIWACRKFLVTPY